MLTNWISNGLIAVPAIATSSSCAHYKILSSIMMISTIRHIVLILLRGVLLHRVSSLLLRSLHVLVMLLLLNHLLVLSECSIVLVVNQLWICSILSFLGETRISPLLFVTCQFISSWNTTSSIVIASSTEAVWNVCIEGVISTKGLLLLGWYLLLCNWIRLMVNWFWKNSSRWMVRWLLD